MSILRQVFFHESFHVKTILKRVHVKKVSFKIGWWWHLVIVSVTSGDSPPTSTRNQNETDLPLLVIKIKISDLPLLVLCLIYLCLSLLNLPLLVIPSRSAPSLCALWTCPLKIGCNGRWAEWWNVKRYGGDIFDVFNWPVVWIQITWGEGGLEEKKQEE